MFSCIIVEGKRAVRRIIATRATVYRDQVREKCIRTLKLVCQEIYRSIQNKLHYYYFN